jgi:proteasome accessory factor A
LHVVVFDAAGQPLPHDMKVARFKRTLNAVLGPIGLPAEHQYDGWFLPNGSRAYYDAWPAGGNFEYATAEHTDPVRLCADLMAGRQLYWELGRRLEADPDISRVELYTCGVDYTRPLISSGLHVNLYRATDRPIRELASHLASLPVLTGVGGFATADGPTLTFVCSPRADHILRAESSDSSGRTRGLVDLYRKPYGRGRRVQEINGDGNQSTLQIAVRVGSSALLLAMVDNWGLSLDELQLKDSLGALRTWNRDPTAKAKLVSGDSVSAIDLQKRLRDAAARKLRRPKGAVPAWAGALVEWWSAAIDAAERGPTPDGPHLDWQVMREAMRSLCAERGVEWSADGAGRMDEVAAELRLLALGYQEVGPNSFCARMEPKPRNHVPGLTEQLIAEVRSTPPPTRALPRGRFVAEFGGTPGYTCRWDSLMAPGRTIKLDDPFDATVPDV